MLQLITRLRPLYIFAAAVLCLIVCLAALRANNATMVKLREDVYQADKTGQDVSAALTKLQHHVVSHMNTDLTPGNNPVYPPIQLKYTYERLQAESAKASSNEQMYNDAQKYCEQQNSSDFSGRNRVPCIQEYVKTHSSTPVATVPDSLYKFDFVSPSWSPDLAGWSLLATLFLFALGIVTWIVRKLRMHKKR